jgi:metal-sulfur cluster biosynthetic enzyme
VISQAQVRSALATVYDPELDEPITGLGFVGSCVVAETGDVDVHLRLPTSQCAPNFAFLMASDARRALERVPGVGEVRVVLDDHYTGEEINAAVGSGAGFAGAFPGETSGDLEALRTLFQRKALLAHQGHLCARLLAGDADPTDVVALRVSDLPDTRHAVRAIALRDELGLPCGADTPALVAGDGTAIPAGDLAKWLRRARLVGLSLESNGGICRSLLRVRYGVPDPTEEVAA